MEKGNLTQAEHRESETREMKEKKQYKQWLKLLAKADGLSKLATYMKIAILYNIHETDAFLQENIGWADYCDKLQIHRNTAAKYLNVARGLIKFCPKATMWQEKKVIFDETKIEAEFKSFLKSEGEVTLETLAKLGMNEKIVRTYFHDEKAGQEISTDDALNMLGVDTAGITTSLEPDSLEIPAIKQGNLFEMEARILKAGYIYDGKLCEYCHPDGTPMTLIELGEFVSADDAFVMFDQVVKPLKHAKDTVATHIDQFKRYTLAFALTHRSPAAEKQLKEEYQKCQEEVRALLYEVSHMLKEDEA